MKKAKNITITTTTEIKIKIDDQEFTLTKQEATNLYENLKKALDIGGTITLDDLKELWKNLPQNPPPWQPIIQPKYPSFPEKYPSFPDIWCESKTNKES